MPTNTIEQQMFEEAEQVDGSDFVETPEKDRKPVPGDYEWSEYVLSLLNSNEFRNHKGKEYPTTDGLKRLVVKLFGPITHSATNVVSAGKVDNDFTVTVLHTITVTSNGRYFPENSSLNFTGAADANDKNLDPPYNSYPTAIAATRALGRACKDLLMIQTCTADELSNVAEKGVYADPEDSLSLTDTQKNGLKNVCKKNGIDIEKFIKLGPFPNKSLDNVLQGTARQMMAVLNGYQNGNPIPTEILLKGV